MDEEIKSRKRGKGKRGTEEKEKEKKDFPEIKVVNCEEDGRLEAKEAWNVPQKKRNNEDFVPMLLMIGKFQFMLESSYPFFPQKRRLCLWWYLLPSSSTFASQPASTLNSSLVIC